MGWTHPSSANVCPTDSILRGLGQTRPKQCGLGRPQSNAGIVERSFFTVHMQNSGGENDQEEEGEEEKGKITWGVGALLLGVIIFDSVRFL